CYNCDEKFVQGHKCRKQFHLLIADLEPDDNPPEPLQMLVPYSEPLQLTDLDPQISDPAQISLHALMGHTIPQTLKVLGHISKSPVMVLIDSGSTHNFIQDRVAKQLGLPLKEAQSFTVLVGNGEQLPCSHMSPQTNITLDSHSFTVDLFVLPLSGADVVLGVQWLKSLGPVLTDYDKLTLQFVKDDKMIQIAGVPRATPEYASLHQLRRLIATDSLDTFCHLELVPSSPVPKASSPHNPVIQQL
ncbi:hypothetical protein A2U01_0034863, partial [Trifolium medium]|nr:hypothetical protein [Trifolium medium]